MLDFVVDTMATMDFVGEPLTVGFRWLLSFESRVEAVFGLAG